MRRIFVVGCPRSGTTLIQTLVACHPALTSFTESHFFDRGYGPWLSGYRPTPRRKSLLDQFGASNDLGTPPVVHDSPGGRETAARFIAWLDATAERRGALGWVEKTPDHVFRIPLIRSVAPDAVFVHVVRDGFGTLPSLFEASRQWGGEPMSWLECYVHWASALRVSARRAGTPGHNLVSYARAVVDPEAVARAIISRVGLPWEPGAIERREEVARSVVGGNETWKANTMGPIRAATLGESRYLPRYAAFLVQRTRVYQRLAALADRETAA